MTLRLPAQVLFLLFLAVLTPIIRPVTVDAQVEESPIRVALDLTTIVDVVHSPDAQRVAVVGTSEVLIFDETGNLTGRVVGLSGVVDAEVSGSLLVVAAAGTGQFVVIDLATASEVRRVLSLAQKVSAISIADGTIWFAHGPDQWDGGAGRVPVDGSATAETYVVHLRAHSLIDVVATRPDSVFTAPTDSFPANLGRYETDGSGTFQTTGHYHQTFRPFAVAPSGQHVIALNNGNFVELDANTLRRTGLFYEAPSPWDGIVLTPEVGTDLVTVASGRDILTYMVGNPAIHQRARLDVDVLGFATEGETVFAATGKRSYDWEEPTELELWITHRTYEVPPTTVTVWAYGYGATNEVGAAWFLRCFSATNQVLDPEVIIELPYGTSIDVEVPQNTLRCELVEHIRPQGALVRVAWDPDANDWVEYNSVTGPPEVTIAPGANLFEVLDVFPNPFSSSEYFIRQQYHDILDRQPTASEQAEALNRLSSGSMSRQQFVTELVQSDEFLGSIAPTTRLYLAYFDRWPDDSGLSYWVDVYRNGYGLVAISTEFALSPEFVNTYGALDDRAFVNLVYRNVLGREPDQRGFDHWMSRMNAGMSRGELMIAFSESEEFRNSTDARIAVRALYKGLLDREPDPGGWDHWEGVYRSGGSLDSLAYAFLESDEYYSRFEITPSSNSPRPHAN